MINKGKYSDISLNSNKFKYYIDSYLQDNIITVISKHPATYNDKSEYLKIYKINIDSKVITNKTLSYDELGFSKIRFDSFKTSNSMTRTIIKSNNEKELNYVLIDSEGIKIKNAKYDIKNGNLQRFIFKNQKLLSANSGGIYLYEIE
ncbi:hypothetical protein [Algibacter lectus]|nr:hypothetical protein [Algibacter lectus]SFB92417.1 hypothetical protein SAMN04489722_101275 [Algibacter lectus]